MFYGLLIGFLCVIYLKLLAYTNIASCNLCCMPRAMKKRLNQQSLDQYVIVTRTKKQCGKIKGKTIETKVISLESVSLVWKNLKSTKHVGSYGKMHG